MSVIGVTTANGRALCRVVLFLVLCPIVLAVTSALTDKIAGLSQTLVLAAVASLCTFALTILFVRWEKLRLDDVGAAPRPSSLHRFALGFVGGLLLVALVNSLAFAAGHVRWVGASTDIAATVMMLITFLALSCREELAFHGYPLRQLERLAGLWSAQVIIALAFAIEHRIGGMPWTRALLGPVAGSLLFGTAAIATRG
ncbi:MAG: CPBP family glutamic-type intramembrane protease, partial [Steroidobacteraceae bacterium]